MFSYQHGYHAGNFADVIKHLSLSRILTYMLQKEKPLFYLETHAGKGLYDLQDKQSLKTQEFKQGILPIWEKDKSTWDPVLLPYIETIHKFNPENKLQYYPGSPAIAIHMLRSQDRLCFYEQHPSEFNFLSQLKKQGKKVQYQYSNGLEGLSAQLPPVEKRGFIFIDPSYEVKEDYKIIPQAVAAAYKRFSTGTYCIWYPILNERLHAQYIRRLQNITPSKTLRLEFMLDPTIQGMKGTGLWIINPPFLLAQEMSIIFRTLKKLFNNQESSFLIEASRVN